MVPLSAPEALTPASILVVRRDNIGDLVCTTPLISALRSRFPDCWIGALVNSYNAPVLHRNPDIDEVFVYTKLKHLEPGASRFGALTERMRSLWQLRRRRLDYVILATPQFVPRAVRLARLLKPKRIVGFSDVGAAARDLDPAVPLSHIDQRHEVERVYDLAVALGIHQVIPPLKVVPDAATVQRASAALTAGGVKIAVQISARRPAQRWPSERFTALVRRLQESGAAVMLLWSPGAADHPRHPGDDKLAAHIATSVGQSDAFIAYRTETLTELIGALSACDAVVTSDGGASHLAAALGKPIACLFGDSPPERWRPWGVPHVVLRPESHRVSDVSVDEVVSACARLLRRPMLDDLHAASGFGARQARGERGESGLGHA